MFNELVPDVRAVSADDLGIGVAAMVAQGRGSTLPDAPEILANDPVIQETVRLARKYGGVIFTGPPGTSKSFYAREAARVICDNDMSHVRFVQFHASYQYEDFMVGFAPTETGFKLKAGPLLELINLATDDVDSEYVLVIDELSRADVGRVFGEALTYIERSKRGMKFTVANGAEVHVPTNLLILATMNPFDRGVDEVDAAFERRFAKITMPPDPDILGEILAENEMDDHLRDKVVDWFKRINNYAKQNPLASVGHAYFVDASDRESLEDIWNYQLKYLVERAFRRDVASGTALETAWENMLKADADQLPPDDVSAVHDGSA